MPNEFQNKFGLFDQDEKFTGLNDPNKLNAVKSSIFNSIQNIDELNI